MTTTMIVVIIADTCVKIRVCACRSLNARLVVLLRTTLEDQRRDQDICRYYYYYYYNYNPYRRATADTPR